MKLTPQVKAVFYMIALMWLIFAADALLPFDFTQFGIEPRTKKGLIGIVFAPFLHASIQHIAYNTIPLFTMSMILAVSYPRRAVSAWILISLTTGILVWLFARKAIHIGASGVIFGLLGFLVVYGLFRRSVGSILISILVAAAYGAYLYGIIPADQRVSWESHLFGLIAGAFWGYVFGKKDRQKVLLRKAGVIKKEELQEQQDN